MQIAWTQHLANDPQRKKDFEATIQNSTVVLDRLKQLIDEKEASFNRTDFDPKEYEAAGWPFKQAYLNGRRAELASLRSLLTL